LKDTTASHAETLAALDDLDRQVAELAAAAADHDRDGGDDDRPGYQPPAAPKFWKTGGPARDQAIGKLRAWVEQVYRPGYGHLAASGPPPGTGSSTRPPTRTRSPGGGGASPTRTWPSPPATRARTCSTWTSTARPGTGSPHSASSGAPGSSTARARSSQPPA